MSSAASWREHIPRGVVAETRAASWRELDPARNREKRREESKNFSRNSTLLHRFQPRTGAKGSQY
jgi:hypothetical protein